MPALHRVATYDSTRSVAASRVVAFASPTVIDWSEIGAGLGAGFGSLARGIGFATPVGGVGFDSPALGAPAGPSRSGPSQSVDAIVTPATGGVDAGVTRFALVSVPAASALGIVSGGVVVRFGGSCVVG